jgi:hypothetical protein
MNLVRLACVAIAAALGATACSEDGGTPLAPIESPPDAGCVLPHDPETYQVFFVIDVSSSMGPYLENLSAQLLSLAKGFPEQNAQGLPVRVDYYLVAFVSDVKVFGGGRMTSLIAIQAAFDDAIAAGHDGYNLTQHTIDSTPGGNVLDALGQVLAFNPSAEAKMVILATDSSFPEAPAILYRDIHVQGTYADTLAAVRAAGLRFHIFSLPGVEGLEANYDNLPPLSSLPGSTVHDLGDLAGASDAIRGTLTAIAKGSRCN